MFRERAGAKISPKLLTREEARRIAANIAKLPVCFCVSLDSDTIRGADNLCVLCQEYRHGKTRTEQD